MNKSEISKIFPKREQLLTQVIKNLLLEQEYNKKKKTIKDSFMKYIVKK